MPRTAGTNGKRPEYRALEIMPKGKAVTPSEINKYVGTGDYASKYMSFLKRDGFGIEVKRDGRNIVSYTITHVPPDAALPPGAFAKEDKPATAKKPAAKKAVAKKAAKKPAAKKKAASAKAKTKVKVPAMSVDVDKLPAKKQVSKAAAKKKAPKEDKPLMDSVDSMIAETNPEVGGGSYAVDSGFDEFDPSELA